MNVLNLRIGDWQMLNTDAKFVREQVFILEQQIPAADEWDAMDEQAIHFVLFDTDQAIATARLLPDHHSGRVAVLKSHRGLGVGADLMRKVMDYADQQQHPFLALSAQVYATAFYEQLGFQRYGEEYLDCGIPHMMMHLKLSDLD